MIVFIVWVRDNMIGISKGINFNFLFCVISIKVSSGLIVSFELVCFFIE